MLRASQRFLQAKKQTQAGYMASAGKVGSEEKWGSAVMEYIYERNHVTDPKKRFRDVESEAQVSLAFDRYNAVGQSQFEKRLDKLVQRMSAALEAIPCDKLRDEAIVINSQQPPLNFRRPSLTPPLFGYEPGFGFDVPQLRNQMMEYPPVVRPTDKIEFSSTESSESFPFVDAHDMLEVTHAATEKLEKEHGEIRQVAPLTGIEGEAWEMYTALNKKALARQQLLIDLANDQELQEKYDSDEQFRLEEQTRRGLVRVEFEEVHTQRLKVDRHYAQDPAYQPVRKY